MKAVIFDLDGVLLSTDAYHFKAWSAIAEKENIYFDEKINNRLRGVSRMTSLDIILEKANRSYSQEEKEVLASEKNEIYKKLLENLTPQSVFEGVPDVIRGLKSRGYKVAVGSSSKNARYILERTELAPLFDTIVDGNDISHSKPDPEVFTKAADRMQIPYPECYVVEDSVAGLTAAVNSGMKPVSMGEEVSDFPGAIHIFDIRELINIIE